MEGMASGILSRRMETMDKQKRNIIIFIIIAVLLVCLVGAALLVGAGVFLYRRYATQAQTQAVVSTASPVEPGSQLETEMNQIEAQVSQERGLSLPGPIERDFLTSDQLAQTVSEEFFKDYTPEEAVQDARSLYLLGLLPKDFDLLTFYKQLYSEQIAGYYDNEEQAMYVVSDSAFSGVERSTYAHEFIHALQDATFDFENGMRYSDEECKHDSERCAALQAVIEGDAVVGENTWLTNDATQQDIIDLQKFYSNYQSPVFDAAPDFMQQDMSFPYQQGAEFVQTLYDQGGYESVNRAFLEQQPASTEQILHPARYPNDKPMQVELPDLVDALGSGWSEMEKDVIGEWYTYLILGHGDQSNWRMQDSLAKAAAEGWGGDAYTILSNDRTGEYAFACRYVWDSTVESNEAFQAFDQYLTLRFGKVDKLGMRSANGLYSIATQNDDGSITWLVAETPDTLLTLSGAFGQ